METRDGDLLKEFTANQSQPAFEELVKRHGPMVMGVCRRVLRNVHDAQDAFQAVFVVLSRKAGPLTGSENIGGWLYRVAYRTAGKLRSRLATHAFRETQVEDPCMLEETISKSDRLWEDLKPVLDAELNRLPEKYREPLVCCYLEGRSYEETAYALKLPHSTIKKRIEHGRELLKTRLARQGVTVSAVALGTLLTEKASAALDSEMISSTAATVTSASLSASPSGAAISEKLADLATETIRSLSQEKLATSAAAWLLAILIAGIGVVSSRILYQKLVGAKDASTVKTTSSAPARHLSTASPSTKHVERGIRSKENPNWPRSSSKKPSSQELEALIVKAFSTKDKAAQEKIFQQIAELTSMEDYPALLAVGKRIHRDGISKLVGAVVSHWAAADLQAVAAWVVKLPNDPNLSYVQENRLHAINALAGIWAKSDPEQAVRWIRETLSEKIEQNRALSQVISIWAKADLETVVAFVEQLPEKERDTYAVASEWIPKDPQRAMVWFEEQSDPEHRDEVYNHVIELWAKSDPGGAMAWVDQLPEGAKRTAGRIGLLSGLAERDPEAAVDLLAQYSADVSGFEEQERMGCISSIANG